MELDANSLDMQDKVRRDLSHTITAGSYNVSVVSNKEMRDTYTGQLGRADRGAKDVRELLLSSGPFRLCAYCMHGEPTTLDHFVPKEHAPALAIDPWNLIPCCARCNHKLLAFFSDQQDSQLFHPYLMPDTGRWLRAAVVPGEPVSVQFFADPDPTLGAVDQERIRNEFDKLDLGVLFAVLSGPDLAETSSVLATQFPVPVPADIRSHLNDAAAGAQAADRNHRRGALFEALASDIDYCSGGYLSLLPAIS